MNQSHTMSLCCVKCGKPLGIAYYIVDDQPWCQECYLRFHKETTLAYSQDWICPRCGRVNSPWVVDHDIWEKAKKKAAEEGHAEDWDYITALYKKMGGEIRGDKSLSGIDWTNHPLIKE